MVQALRQCNAAIKIVAALQSLQRFHRNILNIQVIT